MAHRQDKGNSAHSPPLCMPHQRPVLESLRLPCPVLVQLPQPRAACSSRPRTPSVYSYDEEYCNATTCCSSHSCIKSQPVAYCPFGKREEPQSCWGSCQTCQARREEASCKGACREPPPPCKGVDASTDAAVRFYVDHHTSGEIIPPQSHSMTCFSNTQMDNTCPSMQELALSIDLPLCCRPQTEALPCPSLETSINKSGTSSVSPGGIRKPCCAVSDATCGSGQQVRSCALPPLAQQMPKRSSNSIASGSFQKLAAKPTNPIGKKRKSESKLDVATGTCDQAKCPANAMVCPCRYPPAFSHFQCTGNIGGICKCAQNK